MNTRMTKRTHTNGVDVYKLATHTDAIKFATLCERLKVSYAIKGKYVHVYE